jgi:putative membrane protein
MDFHDQGSPDTPRSPSRTRDYLANGRTFLAWVRTALALIGLGFVLARLDLFLRLAAGRGHEASEVARTSAISSSPPAWP